MSALGWLILLGLIVFAGLAALGWFEVADSPSPFTYERGSLTVEVKCHWYGLKPEKEWIHLRISNKYQLIRRFSGDVVNNIE
jgi:hypothetical protein